MLACCSRRRGGCQDLQDGQERTGGHEDAPGGEGGVTWVRRRDPGVGGPQKGARRVEQGAAPRRGWSEAARSWRTDERMFASARHSSPLSSRVYTSLASAIYFAGGVIAGHAIGLTPEWFLAAALNMSRYASRYDEGDSCTGAQRLAVGVRPAMP